MPPSNPDQAKWFAEHLHPHEAMLRAWLRARFHATSDIDDIVQEAFLRVLTARQSTAIESPKAFLFATARNLALMRLRHRAVERVESLAEIDAASILDDGPAIPAAVANAQELELLTAAIESLPTRCRQILTLRKIYGLSQKEVAAELGISEHTVEAQGTIALHKIAQYFEKIDASRKEGA